MKTKLFIISLFSILLIGCTEMTQLAQSVLTETTSSTSLTQSEIIAGLKEALVTGAVNSSSILSATDGYYKDDLVKILLPDEADIITENISKIPGGDQLIENAIESINRAAEDAAKDVAPIFKSAITSMTITDALNILKGDDDAATQYLRKTTYDQLFNLYQPKIKTSVEKKLVGNISTVDSWDTLTGKWNNVATSLVGQVAGLKSVDTDLESYLTEKALDGMFLKIATEEKEIREDPAARVTSILQKVFGSLD